MRDPVPVNRERQMPTKAEPMGRKMTRLKIAIFSSIAMSFFIPAAAIGAGAGPAGPAADTLQAYVEKTRIPCYRQYKEKRCSIASMTGGVDGETRIFYGKSGTADVAVAFLGYQYDNTGNAMDQMAIVLTDSGGDADGKWKVLGDGWKVIGRADNTAGTNPRDVKFSGDTITYTGTIMRDGDSRAEPTGKARFRIKYGPKGVKFSR